MDSQGVPVDLDYSRIESIEPRQIHALLNCYIGLKTDHLNRFMSECEEHFTALQVEEMHLTALVNALEFKLASIPGLNEAFPTMSASDTTQAQPLPANTAAPLVESSTTTIVQPPPEINEPIESTEEPSANMIRISEHPDFKKFFNMRKFGILDPQIRQAMRSHRINPDDIDLDNPNLLVPYDPPPRNSDSSDQDSD